MYWNRCVFGRCFDAGQDHAFRGCCTGDCDSVREMIDSVCLEPEGRGEKEVVTVKTQYGSRYRPALGHQQ
jgi:hypothetical protein